MVNLDDLSIEDLKKLPPEELDSLVKSAEEAYLHACRTDINTFCEAVLVNPATGKCVKQSPIHVEWHKMADENRNVVIMGHPESGKMLCLDEKIHTPTGTKALRDIERGDVVIDSAGDPCLVTGLSPIDSNRSQYRVKFDDGTSIDACGEHLWKAYTHDEMEHKQPYRVVSTEEMLKTIHRTNFLKIGRKVPNWYIPLTDPVKYTDNQECIDFYTEGVIYSQINTEEVFPEHWIYASKAQKRVFLKSLCSKLTSKYTYHHTNPEFASRLAQLIRSIGYWCRVHKVKGIYFVTWKPRQHKRVVSIKRIKNKPMRCISVDSPDRTYLVGDGFTVTHNTQQLIIARTLFLLGNNPSATIAIAGRALSQAKKSLKSIAEYIEHSDALHKIFPELVPGDNWAAESITVKRPHGIRDPSVQAVGVDGSIHGARLNYLFLDDVLNKTNTALESQRKQIAEKINSEFYTRVVDGGSIVCVSNAWHQEDLMHQHFSQPGWTCKKFPVETDDGTPTWPEQWSKARIAQKRAMMLPLDFAQQYLLKVRDDASSRFKEEYFNNCMVEGNGLEMQYSIEACMLADYDWISKQDPKILNPLSGIRADVRWLTDRGFTVITGVDLAVQKHASADKTVFFTILVYPVYTCPRTGVVLGGERQILNIESGRLDGPEIIKKAEEIYNRFPGPLIIENNAAQSYIHQFANQTLPIIPYNTGLRKADPTFGVLSLASELQRGLWTIPNDGGVVNDEVQEWITGCLLYDPAGHTSDHVMASFFCLEGLRQFGVGNRDIDPNDRETGIKLKVIG